jgi:hypothetical protein
MADELSAQRVLRSMEQVGGVSVRADVGWGMRHYTAPELRSAIAARRREGLSVTIELEAPRGWNGDQRRRRGLDLRSTRLLVAAGIVLIFNAITVDSSAFMLAVLGLLVGWFLREVA